MNIMLEIMNIVYIDGSITKHKTIFSRIRVNYYDD